MTAPYSPAFSSPSSRLLWSSWTEANAGKALSHLGAEFPKAAVHIPSTGPSSRTWCRSPRRRIVHSRSGWRRPSSTPCGDYIASADLASAQVVLEQIPGWFVDYNVAAPHSALGFRSPLQYRSEQSQFGLAESVS